MKAQTQTWTIWPARQMDLPTVMDLLHERVTWLHELGSDQWSTWRRWEPELRNSIKHHRTHLLRDATTFDAVGTITTSRSADPDFWTVEERQIPALYLAKLATRPDQAGKGLGRLMLDWAMYEARSKRLAEVRMDVWRTAPALHAYYRSQGWTQLRTEEVSGRYSGTLFSRVIKPASTPNIPPLEIRPPGGPLTEYTRFDPEIYPDGVLHFDG